MNTLKNCTSSIKFIIGLTIVLFLGFYLVNLGYIDIIFNLLTPIFVLFKTMFHYSIVLFILVFCTYELFPKFILNLGNNFFRKVAYLYEHFDDKINLKDDAKDELSCIDSILTAILHSIPLSQTRMKTVRFKKISHWFFRTIFLSIAFVIILFWDIFWHMMLKHLFQWLSSLKLYDKFSIYVKDYANKYVVLFFFILLFIIMEYFGIYSAVLITTGNIFLAILFYIAKFAMVFPVKILYKEGHDKLVSIPWFKRRKELLVSLLGWFELTASFYKAKEMINSLKEKTKKIFTKIKAIIKRIKLKFKKDKQYRFLFEFKAYRRLLRMKKRPK